MKFVRHHLESISGIEIYPLISLSIFFIFFIALLYYVFKMSKNYIKSMESLPLENEKE